jgi:8-oxo-dGTP pyrophosphatase MutT (NUDIX family)
VTHRYRRPREVAIVVHRPASDGREYLVLLRAPDRQGYWHIVAGGIEHGEEAAAAAARELREETGLDAPVELLPLELSYELAEEPEEVRVRFAPATERVELDLFHASAPAGWEPVLDEEHVEYRWCSAAAAVRLLRWPEPQDAVRVTHALVEGAA